MELVYAFPQDDPEYYTIIGEIYNGLGRLQKIEHIRKIIEDDRIESIFKAIATFPDLEV
jgi:hypothetical protein